MSHAKTLTEGLNIDSDGKDILAYVVGLTIHEDTIVDVFKTIMCSKLDAKEVMVACYFIGRMECCSEIDKENLVELYIERKKHIESLEKFTI